MKRFLSLILASMMIMSLFACQDEKKKEDPKTETPKIESWVGHSFDRIRAEMTKPKDALDTYTVYAAKNETEGASLAVRVTEPGSYAIKTVSGNTEDVKVSLYRIVPTLKLGKKQYTDPALVTGPGDLVKVEKAETLSYLVEFTTTSETPAGDYEYEIAFVDRRGKVLLSHKINLHVWDFAMPEELTFESAVGVGYGKPYYDMLLDHNLSGYSLPYDILSDEANEYMSNPRVTSFVVPDDKTDEELLAIYKKLKTNPDWLKKAVFYPLDEPSTVEHLDELKEKCERLRTLCPDIRITSPYYMNVQYSGEQDQIDFMDDLIDCHCPKLALWEHEGITSNPPFAERMDAIMEKGETVWTYVCNYPLAPYLNVKVDDEGIESRVLFWQMYQRDIDGFLYWSSNYWGLLKDENPWEDIDTFGNGIYGDGILFYPGEKAHRVGPVASIRLKIIRDGIDDIELLYLAEDVLGKDAVKDLAAKVSKSLTTVDVTSDEFAALRIEIGNAIEKGKA